MQSIQAMICSMDRRTAQVTFRRSDLEQPGAGKHDPVFGLTQQSGKRCEA